MVDIAQGKKLLSSNVRLHLEKIKLRQKPIIEEQSHLEEGGIDRELWQLDTERRVLAEKVRHKREYKIIT